MQPDIPSPSEDYPLKHGAVAALILVVVLGGCSKAPAAPKTRPAEPARVEKTLELPGGDGRVHVVHMPTGFMEASKCMVAVGPNGAAAVACAPKDIDLPPPADP